MDQIVIFDSLVKTKLPFTIFRLEEYLFEMGFALFATQTTVCWETFLYQIPM